MSVGGGFDPNYTVYGLLALAQDGANERFEHATSVFSTGCKQLLQE
jgi:hypothetical protein